MELPSFFQKNPNFWLMSVRDGKGKMGGMEMINRLRKEFLAIIPGPRSPHEYLMKGDSGKIMVVGGSVEYTGAPYFAAMGAMKAGADMVHIVCHPDAAGPIKGYSPDFIVHPLMTSGHLPQFDGKIQELLARIDALVIGPGLSRDPTMQFLAHRIFVKAKAFDIPIILDGDGLMLLIKDEYAKDVTNYPQLIMTPNMREMKRLCDKFSVRIDMDDVSYLPIALDELIVKFKGLTTIVLKCNLDYILDNDSALRNTFEKGMPKRCAGQGDVLAGIVSTFASWNKLAPKKAKTTLANVCYEACELLRREATKAYKAKGMSLMTSDILATFKVEFENPEDDYRFGHK